MFAIENYKPREPHFGMASANQLSPNLKQKNDKNTLA